MEEHGCFNGKVFLYQRKTFNCTTRLTSVCCAVNLFMSDASKKKRSTNVIFLWSFFFQAQICTFK